MTLPRQQEPRDWTFEPFVNPSLTEDQQSERFNTYLNALAESGSYTKAAHTVKARRREVLQFRKHNPWFQELCDTALDVAGDRLEGAAIDRAVNGTPRYQLGGRNKDMLFQVGVDHSDRLLELALKRKDPTWSETQKVEQSTTLDVHGLFNYSDLSPRARTKLRELLAIIKEDNEAARMSAETSDSDVDNGDEDPDADMYPHPY